MKKRLSLLLFAASALLISCGDDPDPTPDPDPIKVSGITLSGITAGSTQTLAPGEELNFTLTIAPENATNTTITWSVTPEGMVTITDGKITAGANEGTATVTATAADGSGVSVSFTITVEIPKIPVTSIEGLTDMTLNLEETKTLSYTVLPETASNPTLTWSVTPEGIITLTDDIIKAESAGKATVTATTTDGSDKRATFEVEVTNLIKVLTYTISTESSENEIIVTDAQGGNPKVLIANTADDIFPDTPDISPDGTLVAYAAGDTPGFSVRNLTDGTTQSYSDKGPNDVYFFPIFSADGTMLYATGRDYHHTYQFAAEDGRPERINDGVSGIWLRNLNLTADPEKLMAWDYINASILMLDMISGETSAVVSSTEDIRYKTPALLQKAEKLIYIKLNQENATVSLYSICMSNLDGTGEQQLLAPTTMIIESLSVSSTEDCLVYEVEEPELNRNYLCSLDVAAATLTQTSTFEVNNGMSQNPRFDLIDATLLNSLPNFIGK